MIQIASGVLRGISLRAPDVESTRPTSERLRQTLFNILRHREFFNQPFLEGATVADVFAGSGAVGFEALSNGATSLYLLEENRTALQVLSKNAAALTQSMSKQGFELPEIKILSGSAFKSYARLPSCRLVFCDPPYRMGLLNQMLEIEDQKNKVLEGGIFVAEAEARDEVGLKWKTLRLLEQKNYGDTCLYFFVKLSTDEKKSHLPGEF